MVKVKKSIIYHQNIDLSQRNRAISSRVDIDSQDYSISSYIVIPIELQFMKEYITIKHQLELLSDHESNTLEYKKLLKVFDYLLNIIPHLDYK